MQRENDDKPGTIEFIQCRGRGRDGVASAAVKSDGKARAGGGGGRECRDGMGTTAVCGLGRGGHGGSTCLGDVLVVETESAGDLLRVRGADDVAISGWAPGDLAGGIGRP